MKLTRLLTICAAILGGTLVFREVISQPKDRKSRELRVSFPAARSSLSYEPTDIHLDFEYIFLENIYSPLVEFDVNGVLKPGLAERVEYRGDWVEFIIRPGAKTQSGRPITAEDVAFSLKRLLVLSGNTHGNFRDLICPGVDLKSVESNCPGLRVEGNTVAITAGSRKAFLLPMLASIDFAILPRASVDPKTLKIIDMKETSGPFFVQSDDGKGNIELHLNPYHFHASDEIPDQVRLVPTVHLRKGDSLEALLRGDLDHIPTVDAARADEVLTFIKSHPEFEVHTTHKIRTIVLFFTRKGLTKFSSERRRGIGAKARRAFRSIYDNVPGMEAREEFIPSLGDGSLDSDQHREITRLNQESAGIDVHGPLRIGLIKRNDLETWTEPLKKVLPEAEFYQETDVPDLQKNLALNEIPDALIAATDTGFMEDISLISYSLNAGLLGIKREARSQWLADYMATEQKNERMAKLRQLHFNALAEPVIVPLVASPYTALVRKPWKMELSELYANNQLWRIKHR